MLAVPTVSPVRIRLCINALVALLCWGCHTVPHASAQYRVEWSQVRIRSHGCSGTVIATYPDRSYILTCAHMFLSGQSERIDPRALARSFEFDAYDPRPRPTVRPGIRLVKVDYRLDLALIEVGTGLPYCCPVAPPGHQARSLVSCGFDEMQWPSVVRPCDLIRCTPDRCFSRERPWMGRSGGGQLDPHTGFLTGVCRGFTGAPNRQEISPVGEGIWVSHSAVTRFVTAEANHPPAVSPGPTYPGRPWVSDSSGLPVPPYNP